MWSVYACSWVAYLALLGLALQVENLRHGRFDWNEIGSMFWTLPQAFILALLWPLSGWLRRRRWPLTAILLSHLAGATAFGILSLLLMCTMFKLDKPLGWYVWPLLYTMMIYGVIASIFHTVRMHAAARHQALAIQQAHALLVASELNALRSKLNPHFLFNTLHSIIALTRKDPDAAETALFQFSDMLRYVLDTEKSGSDRVTLAAELDFVRDYLQLEALRLGGRLNVDWQLDAAAAALALPALSLQPLVENSIKHAFNPHSRPGRLTIRSRVQAGGGALALSVGDDGPGADLAAVRRSNGLGLRTVERRLRLEYGEDGRLAIDTAPGAGFTVTISIPLDPHQEPSACIP
ncbi:histidine kinase [Massilia forsythiae]|uniref:histidine kinase n=2 Tax=Massilia forsythiae TaxID=2728020 RepID=A0A7Z2W1X4_9BURK|nr:histidine kinase [Massilia forsythiae]